jgi:hypothetical protein
LAKINSYRRETETILVHGSDQKCFKLLKRQRSVN